MIDKTYLNFNCTDRAIIIKRLSNKLYSTELRIKNVLETMDPPISIEDGKIIMAIATLERIKKELIKLDAPSSGR